MHSTECCLAFYFSFIMQRANSTEYNNVTWLFNKVHYVKQVLGLEALLTGTVANMPATQFICTE